MINRMRLVYSLRVRDLQHVAKKEFDHTLTDEEIEIIDNKLGEYIGWYEPIAAAIEQRLSLERLRNPVPADDDDDYDSC